MNRVFERCLLFLSETIRKVGRLNLQARFGCQQISIFALSSPRRFLFLHRFSWYTGCWNRRILQSQLEQQRRSSLAFSICITGFPDARVVSSLWLGTLTDTLVLHCSVPVACLRCSLLRVATVFFFPLLLPENAIFKSGVKDCGLTQDQELHLVF